jgi:MFS superfamily sulfate permease-like transporter
VTIARIALHLHLAEPGAWRADWAWGVPLILLTVVIHVLGLGLMNWRSVRTFAGKRTHRHPTFVFVSLMGTVTLFAICLHVTEAAIWAACYEFLGALPDFKSAMLYSLGAITTFGNSGVFLEDRWRLMGAIEALSGWLLFGLTTAFLFGMIQKVWWRLTAEDTHEMTVLRSLFGMHAEKPDEG